MVETNTPLTPSSDATDKSLPIGKQYTQQRSGEDAVRRAAEAVVNRSGTSDDKRVRRRSRRQRSTPILAEGGLKFHYAVGFLLLFTLVMVFASDKISLKIWKIFHAAPDIHKIAVAPPWWFRVEIPAVLLGFGIWLYLTPGVWDKLMTSLGLKKEEDRRARRRHS